MKISNKTSSNLIFILGLVLAVLLVVIFFKSRREGFHQDSAKPTAILCAIQYYQEQNPKPKIDLGFGKSPAADNRIAELTSFMNTFDVANAKTRMNTDKNFVLKEVQKRGGFLLSSLNSYTLQLMKNTTFLNSMCYKQYVNYTYVPPAPVVPKPVQVTKPVSTKTRKPAKK
jgi:hypothetical protein